MGKDFKKKDIDRQGRRYRVTKVQKDIDELDNKWIEEELNEYERTEADKETPS